MNRFDTSSTSLQWRACPIHIAPLVFFDIETTGLRPDRGARITEIAVVGHKGTCFDWSREQAPAGERSLSPVLPHLFGRLRAGVVVGHNLHFDFRFVAYEADRLGYDGLDLRFIDTLGLARAHLEAAHLEAVEDYRLETLLRTFDVVPDGDLHTALVDARAARALFWKLVDVGHIETLGEAGMKRLNWSTF